MCRVIQVLFGVLYITTLLNAVVEILYFYAINVSMKEKSDGYIWR